MPIVPVNTHPCNVGTNGYPRKPRWKPGCIVLSPGCRLRSFLVWQISRVGLARAFDFVSEVGIVDFAGAAEFAAGGSASVRAEYA